MMTHWNSFSRLPAPTNGVAYTVEPGRTAVRAARSSLGHAALLVSFKHNGSSLPRRLVNLAYRPPAMLEMISSVGERRVEEFAVLECCSSDEELQRYFFRIADAVLTDQAAAESEKNFERAIDKLVALFRALRNPGSRSIQGLWAELAIICWASHPSSAISAWHSSPLALHDFANGDFKLEVKSSQSGLREHHFRLAQLAAIQTGDTVVASLLLRKSDYGSSVHDLVEVLRGNSMLTRASIARVETIVAETLGADWHRAADVRFDLEAARADVSFYDACAIPSVPQPLPTGVKEVQFVADLSNAVQISVEQLRERAQFYAAVGPNPLPTASR